ncbi:MAG: periplasmic heavy metal sensor [Betaproteobacteria bacterium]
MKTRFSPRLIIIAVATSIGLAASAYAMPPMDGVPGGHAGKMHERHMARGLKEMSKLHDELQLDAKQEALWKQTETASKDSRSAMHERFSKHHEEVQNLINQPGADLRAVAKRMSEIKNEGQKLHEANLERWLTMYDALNAEQKEKARLFFKAKLDRFSHSGKFGKTTN